MTVNQIITELKEAKKPISRETFYTYCRRWKIKPLGARQRPQLYPEDTALRIKLKLGIVGNRITVTPKLVTKKSRR